MSIFRRQHAPADGRRLDNLLAGVVCKVAQRYRTRSNSILFVARPRWCQHRTLNRRERAEAFQFQDNAANVFYAYDPLQVACSQFRSSHETLRRESSVVVKSGRRRLAILLSVVGLSLHMLVFRNHRRQSPFGSQRKSSRLVDRGQLIGGGFISDRKRSR